MSQSDGPSPILPCCAVFRGLFWTLMGIFALAFYHLCLIPGLLDYSLYGFGLLAAGVGGLLLILPAGSRRQPLSFLLAVIFAYEAQSSISFWEFPGRLLGAVIIFAAVLMVARTYGRLNRMQLAALLLASLVILAVGPKSEIRLYSNFALLWESPSLYADDIFPYFPLHTGDLTGDGTTEILTWGNRDETPSPRETDEQADPPSEPAVLQPEEIYPYMFSWDGTALKRTPQSDMPTDVTRQAERLIHNHYPGFPYYAVGDGRIDPLTTPEQLAAGVMRFSQAPSTAIQLTAHAIDARGQIPLDRAKFPEDGYDEIILQDGQLQITTSGETLSTPSDATQIIGPVRTADGDRRLALLGPTLQLVSVETQQQMRIETTHVLGDDQVQEAGLLDVLIADVDGDKTDEVLLSSRHDPARILKPLPDGSWQVLWMAQADDAVFRFEEVIDDGHGPAEIIALRPSLVRDDPHRYLTGYHLFDGQLEPVWRSMMNLVDVRGGDVTGDGHAELVGLRWGEHRFWVLQPHGIPITQILWTAAALAAGLGLYFRLRSLSAADRYRLLGAVVALSAAAGILWAVQIMPLHTYQTAESRPPARVPAVEEPYTEAPEFTRLLEDSVLASEEQQKFWYSGWIASYVGKRQINSMYEGTVHLPDGYVSSMRVVGNPLRLFRRNDTTYLEERDNFFRGETAGEIMPPFSELMNLLTESDRFTPLQPEPVMGMPCWTYESTLTLPEWVQMMSHQQYEEWIPDGRVSSLLLQEGTVHTQIWIGKAEPFIHQYVTTIRMPLPGAGHIKQEVLFRFYRYGDENIQPVDLQRLERYLSE